MNNFQRGDLLPVFFQAAGTTPAQRLNVTGWNGDREVLTFDVTHTGLGGETGRIGGKRDGRGTIMLDFDLDAPPWAVPPAIVEGISGIVLEYVATTLAKFIQTPVIIKKVHFESSVTSQLKYSVDWEFNKLAGSFSYPTP